MQYAPVSTHDEATTSTEHSEANTAPPPYVDLSGKIGSDDRAPQATSSNVDSSSLDGKISTATSSDATPSAVATGFTAYVGSLFSAAPTPAMNNNSGSGGNGGGAASASSMLGLDSAEVSGFVSKLRNRRWAATLRPLPTFAAQTQFSRPRSQQEAMARFEANLPYFLTNYLALCAVVVLITILTQPSLIIVGAVLAALWVGATRVEELRLPGQVVLAGRNKMVALLSVSGLVLFIFAGSTIFMLLGLCASIVLIHALLHVLPPLEEGGDSNEMDEFIGSNGDFDPSPA